MIPDILKSDVILYYVAAFLGIIAVTMLLIFIPFKSVATLMMMVSGLGILGLGLMILCLAIVWDLKRKYLDKDHASVHSD
ncbi:MAG: hypothetical protein KAR76_03265 [Methanosarcinales archaeon]|nr:hypothetical protein [Methanosarcinales archaeon]